MSWLRPLPVPINKMLCVRIVKLNEYLHNVLNQFISRRPIKREPGKWELGCQKCLLVYNAIVIIHNVSTDEQMTTESETISISISIHTERKITAKWTMDDLLNKLC